MMFGGTLRIEVMCSGRLTLYGSEMWTPAQRSARLLPPARAADRPGRGVPGSELVLPRAPASGSGSPSAASVESSSKLSGTRGLGRGLLGGRSASGSARERAAASTAGRHQDAPAQHSVSLRPGASRPLATTANLPQPAGHRSPPQATASACAHVNTSWNKTNPYKPGGQHCGWHIILHTFVM